MSTEIKLWLENFPSPILEERVSDIVPLDIWTGSENEILTDYQY